MEEQVRLSRPGVTIPWGFRLQGGADFNQRLVVQRVAADGIAARAQIKLGDVLVKVNGVETLSLTHKQACDLVGAAELQLILTIVRQHNAHRLWTHDGSESRESVVVTSAAVPQTTGAAIAAVDGASQQQQQVWLPSSELMRRASATLTPSPLSPRAPRRAPWDRAPSQSDAEQYPSLPPPPPPPVVLAPTPLGDPNQTSGGAAASAAAATLLGAQLLRLQLKSPQPPAPSESDVAAQRGTVTLRTAPPIPFAPQRDSTRGAAGAYIAAPAVAATTTAPRRGSATRVDGTATYDLIDSGAERETSARAFPAAATASATGQASLPQTLQYRRDSGGILIHDGIQTARNGPVSTAGSDASAASAPRGQLPQQEPRRNSQGAAESGGGQRAAYLIQPGGVVTAIQWNDRPLSPDVDKSAVLAALREEQELGVGGSSRRRSSSSNKHGYSFRVLQLITGTADDDEDRPDGDSTVKSTVSASSAAPAAVSTERAFPASPTSPTGSVFSSSPTETSPSGKFGLRRHVSPFQDDYSDF